MRTARRTQSRLRLAVPPSAGTLRLVTRAVTGSEDLSTLRYDGGVLDLLDQRVLPHRVERVRCESVDEVREAITDMVVRGAPAIGVAAAYGVAIAVRTAAGSTSDVTALLGAVEADAARLTAARPTAVNLAAAVRGALAQLRQAAAGGSGGDELVRVAEGCASRLERSEAEASSAMGRLAAGLLPDRARLLVHCNAGALATVERGTALAAVRQMHEEGRLDMVYVDETRPRLQGARLTAFELARAGIPHTLIVDSLAATLMRAGRVDAVLVGADRIAANGDVANKVGTYGLAVACHHHGVPFIVVAPTSTVDPTCPDGDHIPIEERDPGEVTGVGAARMAPASTPAFNPAFDVTPAAMVRALVTEAGVASPVDEESVSAVLAGSVPVEM